MSSSTSPRPPAGFARFAPLREFAPARSGVAAPMPGDGPSVPLAAHEAALSLAAANGRAQGFEEGRRAAREEEEARLARALEAVAAGLRAAQGGIDAAEAAAAREGARLALRFARLLAGSLIEAAPLAPLEEAFRAVSADLRGSPHVAVRVPPALVEAARDRLAVLARELGVESRVVVLGDPDAGLGDARVEWADGAARRDGAALEAALAAAVDAALLSADPAPLPGESP